MGLPSPAFRTPGAVCRDGASISMASTVTGRVTEWSKTYSTILCNTAKKQTLTSVSLLMLHCFSFSSYVLLHLSLFYVYEYAACVYYIVRMSDLEAGREHWIPCVIITGNCERHRDSGNETWVLSKCSEPSLQLLFFTL